jgi:hypothetical protein
LGEQQFGVLHAISLIRFRASERELTCGYERLVPRIAIEDPATEGARAAYENPEPKKPIQASRLESGISGASGILDARLFHTVRHSQAQNDQAMDGSSAFDRSKVIAKQGSLTQSDLLDGLQITSALGLL